MITLFGIFLSAIYSFTLLTRIAFGPASPFIRAYFDLTRREVYILSPILFLVIFLGLFPYYLTDYWIFSISSWFCQEDIWAFVPLFFTKNSIFNFLKKKALILYTKFYLYENILVSLFLLVFTLLIIKNNTFYCGDIGTEAPILLLQDATTQAILEQMTDTEDRKSVV